MVQRRFFELNTGVPSASFNEAAPVMVQRHGVSDSSAW